MFWRGFLVLSIAAAAVLFGTRFSTVPGDSQRDNPLVVGPIAIDAAPRLSSGTTWDSGIMSIPRSLALSGRAVTLIDLTFADTALYMVDRDSDSLEKVKVEILGTVRSPEAQASGDVIEFSLRFDERAIGSNIAAGSFLLSSSSGRATAAETVDLDDGEYHAFLFRGFTLELDQNGTGASDITAFRVRLEADELQVAR